MDVHENRNKAAGVTSEQDMGLIWPSEQQKQLLRAWFWPLEQHKWFLWKILDRLNHWVKNLHFCGGTFTFGPTYATWTRKRPSGGKFLVSAGVSRARALIFFSDPGSGGSACTPTEFKASPFTPTDWPRRGEAPSRHVTSAAKGSRRLPVVVVRARECARARRAYA